MDQKPQETIVTKVKPTKLPVQCPVCRGFGTLKYGAKICQGCNGKGYILVPAEEIQT